MSINGFAPIQVTNNFYGSNADYNNSTAPEIAPVSFGGSYNGTAQYGSLAGAQSFLSSYAAGPAGAQSNGTASSQGAVNQSGPYGSFPTPVSSSQSDSTGESSLTGERVGWGYHEGQGIDKLDAKAEKMLQSGKIDQSQYQEVTQISQSVSNQLQQDDDNDGGQKLSKGDFTEANAALAQARAIL
jgi:hypothetical protein